MKFLKVDSPVCLKFETAYLNADLIHSPGVTRF